MTCLSRLEVVGGNPIQACLDPRSRTLSTPPSLGGLGGGLATKSRLAWLVSDREASDLCSELLCLISLQHCSVRVLLAQRLFGVTNRGPTGTTFQQAERIIS